MCVADWTRPGCFSSVAPSDPAAPLVSKAGSEIGCVAGQE